MSVWIHGTHSSRWVNFLTLRSHTSLPPSFPYPRDRKRDYWLSIHISYLTDKRIQWETNPQPEQTALRFQVKEYCSRMLLVSYSVKSRLISNPKRLNQYNIKIRFFFFTFSEQKYLIDWICMACNATLFYRFPRRTLN